LFLYSSPAFLIASANVLKFQEPANIVFLNLSSVIHSSSNIRPASVQADLIHSNTFTKASQVLFCTNHLNSSAVIQATVASFCNSTHHFAAASFICQKNFTTAVPQAAAFIQDATKAVDIHSISVAVKLDNNQAVCACFAKPNISCSLAAKLLPNQTKALHKFSISVIGTHNTSENLFNDVAASSALKFVAIPNQAATSVNFIKLSLHLTHNCQATSAIQANSSKVKGNCLDNFLNHFSNISYHSAVSSNVFCTHTKAVSKLLAVFVPFTMALPKAYIEDIAIVIGLTRLFNIQPPKLLNFACNLLTVVSPVFL